MYVDHVKNEWNDWGICIVGHGSSYISDVKSTEESSSAAQLAERLPQYYSREGPVTRTV